MNDDTITVEVAYALPTSQKLLSLQVTKGTTAKEAVEQSQITTFYPDLDLNTATMGIFGQTLGTKGLAKAEAYVLNEGDRVELYRPLIADPKEARRKRAEKSSKS